MLNFQDYLNIIQTKEQNIYLLRNKIVEIDNEISKVEARCNQNMRVKNAFYHKIEDLTQEKQKDNALSNIEFIMYLIPLLSVLLFVFLANYGIFDLKGMLTFFLVVIPVNIVNTLIIKVISFIIEKYYQKIEEQKKIAIEAQRRILNSLISYGKTLGKKQIELLNLRYELIKKETQEKQILQEVQNMINKNLNSDLEAQALENTYPDFRRTRN